MGKIYSWHTSEIYMDIGNESSLKKANIALAQTLNKNLKNLK